MRGRATCWGAVTALGLLFLLPALLLVATLGYCGVPSEGVRMARSNTLDEVLGEAELLVPAERGAVGSIISPGGEWLLVKVGQAEWIVFDLDSGAEQALDLSCAEDPDSWTWARWLNERQFVITTSLSRCYYLIEMPEVTTTPLPVVSEDPERLAEASPPIYVTKSLVMGGFTAFALGDDPFVMHISGSESAPPPWAAAIPHIEVPQQHGYTGLQQVPSHSGRCYATAPSGVQIYATNSDTLLARAFKSGWSHSIRGWAHDDSGVYFKLSIEGSDGAVFYPWQVIWKLKVPEGASCGAGE